ncbi:Chitin deacetylase protein [Rutstroemia sp. NJR-2017a BBW]|nr:Chitin deacetylase protein [Rutstroemia sp. NJR-2017a BBW]
MQLSYTSSVVLLGLISGTCAVPFTPLQGRAVSPDNTCGTTGSGGNTNAYTCPTELPCCSTNGWCGSTDAYCLSTNGCQSGFGTCTVVNVTISTGSGGSSATDQTCGPGIGSCASNECCSLAGYCGTTEEYCRAPDCQFTYGPACDANKVPSGTNTSSIARTPLGSVLYGSAGIYDCANAGDMALTFDDGPYIYTSHILDVLDKYNAKATFFITGNNNAKGAIDDTTLAWPALIKYVALVPVPKLPNLPVPRPI